MATEVEVIKFEGDLSALKKDLKTAEASFSTLENKGKTAAKNTETSFSKLGSSVKNVLQNLPFGDLINDLETASQSARGLGSSVASVGTGAQSAGGGCKGFNFSY